ncbi:MAG: serine hydrolase domain-containing protein [Acidobacteriota bacterium]|nr:serine hydrolase domain-containing protein [Acidobacteriota bacterium]
MNLEGIDGDALNRLMDGATGSHTDAMVVYRGETRVGAWYFGKEPKKIDAGSIGITVAGLGLGILMDQGKITSLDQPLSNWYPELKEGEKAEITLEHLIGQTTGLGTHSVNDLALDASEDFIKFALETRLVSPPGKIVKQNPRAGNLLGDIIAKVSGQSVDTFLAENLFSKMGITDVTWAEDKAGNTLLMSGMEIFPEDLAKIGVMCMQRGKWEGKQLISRSWFEKSFAAVNDDFQNRGRLWWRIHGKTIYVIDQDLLDKYREAGVDGNFIEGMSRLQGRYSGRTSLMAVFKGALGERWQDTVSAYLAGTDMQVAKREYSDLMGYNANGKLGQRLVLFPQKNLVGVRMISEASATEPARDDFANFGDLLRHLVDDKK